MFDIPWFLLLYYSAEFIFPDFPGQNELFSPTNLFLRNTNVKFSIACNHTRNKGGGTNLNGGTNNLRVKQAEKMLYTVCLPAQQFKIFSAFLLAFAPWFFYFPRLPLAVETMYSINPKFFMRPK